MDINYHYFAIKTIAKESGFDEPDAQRIAVYSQYVDDFDKFAYMPMKIEDIPQYARHLAKKIPVIGWVFNPVTTGFPDWYDMTKLVIERYQRMIVIPFHFIPKNKKLNDQVSSKAEWRVSPASLEEPSLIQSCLLHAKDMYRNGNDKQLALMKIGMLLHTFADTYAHQQFSGFQGWENHSRLMKVTNNIDYLDITDEYEPGVYFQLPSVGHTNVNHAPDDSNVIFVMSQKLNEGDDEYSLRYQRSNTEDFLLASHEILNYLRYCLGKDSVSSAAWNAFAKRLSAGFLTKQKKGNYSAVWLII